MDILTRVSAEDLSRVEGNDAFYVNRQTPPAQVVAIYQHNGPLGDLKLRQAVAHAIDRQGIATAIMKGTNTVGYSSLPTTSSFYEALEPKFEFDLDKARALLAELAYPDGVTLRMSTSTLVPNQLEIDQIIAASLRAIGINVEVERLEVGAFRSSYNTYGINLNTLAIFNYDPDFVLGLYIGGTGAELPVETVQDGRFKHVAADIEAVCRRCLSCGPSCIRACPSRSSNNRHRSSRI